MIKRSNRFVELVGKFRHISGNHFGPKIN
jgi:hypothetical protein